MEINTKFLDIISFPADKELFDVATSIFVSRSEGNNPHFSEFKTLSHEQKIKVTKIFEFINKAAGMIKRKGEIGYDGVNAALEKCSEKKFIMGIINKIHFDKTLNNYRLIKLNKGDAENKTITYFNNNTNFPLYDFTKVEWKIEIVLSSINMRKVLRPMVIMVIHTKQGRKSFTIDPTLLQEMRKNFALMLRNIHQIELKNLS